MRKAYWLAFLIGLTADFILGKTLGLLAGVYLLAVFLISVYKLRFRLTRLTLIIVLCVLMLLSYYL